MNNKELAAMLGEFIREHKLEDFDEIAFKIIRNGNPMIGNRGTVLRYYKKRLWLEKQYKVGIPLEHVVWTKGTKRLIERSFKHLKPIITYDEDPSGDYGFVGDFALVTFTDCPRLSNGWIYVPSMKRLYSPDRMRWYDEFFTKRYKKHLLRILTFAYKRMRQPGER
ncbi:hypothetical protein [Fusobacterium necrophorum]|uniref:hypothetical protein n=1 Tax=Fusobacterium necrophorum TaxID=859 RepID=UPI00254C8918|nr:hypothetical protein [Fusobacterium necrophorum]MDK4523132.1 hypothetical protein [Fusobacterium necrophorum]